MDSIFPPCPVIIVLALALFSGMHVHTGLNTVQPQELMTASTGNVANSQLRNQADWIAKRAARLQSVPVDSRPSRSGELSR